MAPLRAEKSTAKFELSNHQDVQPIRKIKQYSKNYSQRGYGQILQVGIFVLVLHISVKCGPPDIYGIVGFSTSVDPLFFIILCALWEKNFRRSTYLFLELYISQLQVINASSG